MLALPSAAQRRQLARSSRREVRNPILGLPASGRLIALPPEIRQCLAALLDDLSKDARARAEESWRRHKGPIAVYWKAVAVYARHIARALRQFERPASPTPWPDAER